VRICCPVSGVSQGSRMTGAASDDRNILQQLALLSVKIEVVLPEERALESGPEANYSASGLTIHRVRVPAAPRLAHSVARIIRFPRAVLALYREYKFDLLRVHSFFSSCLEVSCMRAFYNLPVPVVVHFYHLDDCAWRNLIVRATMRRCNAVIASSQASKHAVVKQFGVASSKVHVVQLGIERRFQPAPPSMQLLHQLGCSPQEQIILFLGTLEPRKNPLFLLDVLKELLAANANVKLIMCGTGPLWGAIGRRIAQLGLQNHVLLPGIIPEELMPDYYNIADVFVFPSSLEGFGFVMGEAMSCGKPVVALNTSAMPEVVEDGVTGFLASPHDNADFVRKTLLLLDHEELRLRMGVQARERIERLFRWERAAKETLNIYQQTIEQFHWGPLRDSARARARE